MSSQIRILAIAALIIAVPILFLKLPWLPATVQSFVQTVSESTVDGSEAFVKEHNERLWRGIAALALYVIGLCSVLGLLGVAFGLCRHPVVQRIAWLCALISAAGVPLFDASRIGPSTDGSYLVLVIYLPLAIAVLALVALVISLRMATNSESSRSHG